MNLFFHYHMKKFDASVNFGKISLSLVDEWDDFIWPSQGAFPKHLPFAIFF